MVDMWRTVFTAAEPEPEGPPPSAPKAPKAARPAPAPALRKKKPVTLSVKLEPTRGSSEPDEDDEP